MRTTFRTKKWDILRLSPLRVLLLVFFAAGLLAGRMGQSWMSAELSAAVAEMVGGALSGPPASLWELYRSVLAVYLALEGAVLLCGLCWCPALPLAGFFFCFGCGAALGLTAVAQAYRSDGLLLLGLGLVPLFTAAALGYLQLADLVAAAGRRLLSLRLGQKGTLDGKTAQNAAVKLFAITATIALFTMLYSLVRVYLVSLPSV